MSVLKSNVLLLITAAIWGLAFVAQRVGMDYVGPFTYNGVRFFLGSLSLIPLIFYFRGDAQNSAGSSRVRWCRELLPARCCWRVSLQQVGLVYTTAGKAAFITGLYVVLVPLISILLGRKIGVSSLLGVFWPPAALPAVHQETLTVNYGDMLQLIGHFSGRFIS